MDDEALALLENIHSRLDQLNLLDKVVELLEKINDGVFELREFLDSIDAHLSAIEGKTTG